MEFINSTGQGIFILKTNSFFILFSRNTVFEDVILVSGRNGVIFNAPTPVNIIYFDFCFNLRTIFFFT